MVGTLEAFMWVTAFQQLRGVHLSCAVVEDQ